MKKLALIGVVLFVIGLVGLVLTTGPNFTTETVEREKTVTTDGVETVEVKLDVGKINIVESNRDDIHVHFEGNVAKNRLNFQVNKKGSHVEIDTKSKSGFLSVPFINFSFNEKRVLTVTIPKDGLTKVVVNGDATNINVETESVKELVATSDVGKISVEKFSGERMTLRNDVGAVDVRDASGEIDIQTDTGTIALTIDDMTEDIRLKSDVGTVSVNLKKVPEALRLDLDSDVGKVKVAGLSDFDNVSGAPIRAEKGQGGPMLYVRTDVGSITIEH